MKRMKQAPEDLDVIRNVTPTTGGAICGHQLCVERKWSQKYQILTLERAISDVSSFKAAPRGATESHISH